MSYVIRRIIILNSVGKSVVYFVQCFIILILYNTDMVLQVAIMGLDKVLFLTITLKSCS
jgi:hypothetical protein